ncbi:hypothetical protein GCM10010289_15260 [Streptomyces violascens]|uniref:Uncharacterized protein n=1 Tax=Streptomyces violascens TaxID=67381 RepID=A0ABQ3QJH6_9ACTN|nr:hypothetical protein GCM10010289_15260 [Streptomyces violascens]GHI37426.1 hypothetical protein Sviol_18340 [Streptomyces violascens]
MRAGTAPAGGAGNCASSHVRSAVGDVPKPKPPAPCKGSGKQGSMNRMSDNRSTETHPHTHQESFSPWPPSGADLPDYPVTPRPAHTPSWAHPETAASPPAPRGGAAECHSGKGRGGG